MRMSAARAATSGTSASRASSRTVSWTTRTPRARGPSWASWAESRPARTESRPARTPAVPTRTSAPAESSAPRVATPIETWSLPAVVVPAVTLSAEEILGLFDVRRKHLLREAVGRHRVRLASRTCETEQSRVNQFSHRISVTFQHSCKPHRLAAVATKPIQAAKSRSAPARLVCRGVQGCGNTGVGQGTRRCAGAWPTTPPPFGKGIDAA